MKTLAQTIFLRLPFLCFSSFRQAFLQAIYALIFCGGLALTQAQSSAAQTLNSIVLASTTSTEQSGLFAHLLPEFTKASGVTVKVVALGTGQALDMARRGDADVVLVHDLAAEEKFVAEGFGIKRFDVMYNDFVLIGPVNDPAKISGRDIASGLKKLAASGAPFVSRADKSGTHAAELRYWGMAGLVGKEQLGVAYKECGCSMGQALNIAAATSAYVLSDRGTWLNFKNRSQLAVLVEGDRALLNPYGVIAVSSTKHPQVKAREAQIFVDWLLSNSGQTAIANYKIGGQTVFFPSAKDALHHPKTQK